MGALYRIALVLVIIGAINWGLIGFFQFDLVAFLFGGQSSTLSRLVYGLVGIAGLISIPILAKPLTDEEVPYSSTERERVKYARFSTEASDEFGHYDEKEFHNRNNNKHE